MEIIAIVEFKSNEIVFKKECSGIKNNTVRLVNTFEDTILKRYIGNSFTLNIQYIKIKHVNGKDCFIRKISDITRCVQDDIIIYIFTWEI